MRIEDKLSEECAVFGVSLTMDEAVGITYNGLLSLQHRGQEGAGIALSIQHKDTTMKPYCRQRKDPHRN